MVLDRCDAATTAIIERAIQEARGFGHPHVGTEHALLSITQQRELLPGRVAELLPTADAVRDALASAPDRSPQPQAELLETVGVDLERVRAAVRRTFGADAVERLRRPVRQPWQPWRRPSRRCTSLLAGSMTIAPRFKEALERALHEAERRGIGSIDPAALLVGMLQVEGARSNEILRRTDVDPATVLSLLEGD